MRAKENLNQAYKKILTSEISKILAKRNDFYQFYAEQPILYTDPKLTAGTAAIVAIEIFTALEYNSTKSKK